MLRIDPTNAKLFSPMTPNQQLVEFAHSIGFQLAAIIPSRPSTHLQHLEDWLDQGCHGEMTYMSRNLDLRAHTALLHPGTQTVLALAALYKQEQSDPFLPAYARDADYHDVLRARLKQLVRFAETLVGLPKAAIKARGFVDSAPVLERDLARLAGLGWIGKNTCLIHPQLGSYLFLAEVCLPFDLAAETPPALQPERCGTCTRCLAVCPTNALAKPRWLDARACISYLTIELRGAIPLHLRRALGSHLFGCDDCQSVCPWNRKAPTTIEPAFIAKEAFQPIDFLGLDEPTFRAKYRKTPLFRAHREGMARNACVVIANTRQREHLPALADTLRRDPSPMVRGHAAWALGELGESELLRDAHAAETDASVLEEISRALAEPTDRQPQEQEEGERS